MHTELATVRGGIDCVAGKSSPVGARSFAVEVIADDSGKFCGNGWRDKTREKAESAARDLASRWTAVREWRVVESADEPNRD